MATTDDGRAIFSCGNQEEVYAHHAYGDGRVDTSGWIRQPTGIGGVNYTRSLNLIRPRGEGVDSRSC